MGSGYRTFTAGEVLTASNVQDYLMDQSVMVFADSTARETAIGTANFEEGMTSYLQDTNLVEVYNGTTWASIAPAAVTPGLVQIGTAISFSGVSAQNVDSLFSSTYENYKIILRTSHSNTIKLQGRVGASTISTANYTSQKVLGDNVTASASRISGGNDFTIVSNALTGSKSYITIELGGPNLAEHTTGTINAGRGVNTLELSSLLFDANDQFTGIRFFPTSGTMTGTVSVYGYNN
jgi:hypothetical protein